MGQIQPCDHTSVGIIARDDKGRILMIERRKAPFGFAPPAGHIDGRSGYDEACHKEFEEETGLRIVGAPRPMLLIKNAKINNKCRRGGEFHYWHVYEVDWKGEIKQNFEETKWIGWLTVEGIKDLALKTKEYLSRYKLASQAEEFSWTKSIRESLDKEWQYAPGLEVAWLIIFEELKVI